jgi:hypothetical protein
MSLTSNHTNKAFSCRFVFLTEQFELTKNILFLQNQTFCCNNNDEILVKSLRAHMLRVELET